MGPFDLGFCKGGDKMGPVLLTATTTMRDWETLELMNALARKMQTSPKHCV